MEIPGEAVAGLAAVGTAVLAGIVAGVKWLASWWASKATKDAEKPRAPQLSMAHIPRVARLDAASVHERADAAIAAGADACVAFVKALSEEAAREECASCTALRKELKVERDARIQDLQVLLPAIAKSSASMDAAAAAVQELVDFQRGGE